MKKIFFFIMFLIGLNFTYLSLSRFWGYFEPLPTHDELVQECEVLFSEGSYSKFTNDERLDACLEDSYKAVGVTKPFTIIVAFVFGVLAMIFLFFGLKFFKKRMPSK